MDEKPPNLFLRAASYVLSAVALSVLINLASQDWGWTTLGPVLAVAAWLGVLAFMHWLPDTSRLAHYIGLGIVVVLPLTWAALYWLAERTTGDPGLSHWLWWDAGVSAALLSAAVLGAPGLLSRYDVLAFAFFIAFTLVVTAPLPGWLKGALGTATMSAFLLGFLSVYRPTAPAMAGLGRRCRELWHWLIEEGGALPPDASEGPSPSEGG